MKSDIASTSNSRKDFIRLKDGDKIRMKFLVDFPDGTVVKMYNDFASGTHCRVTEETYSSIGESMKYRNEYIWPVLVDGEVKLYKEVCNRITPIRQLFAFYEEWGSIKGKEFVVSLSGRQLEKVYTLIPLSGDTTIPDSIKVPTQDEILNKVDAAFSYKPPKAMFYKEINADEIDDPTFSIDY